MTRHGFAAQATVAVSLVVATSLATASASQPAVSQPPAPPGIESASARCDARRCCVCPDDYCPKPLPCVPCVPRGCCDDYCAKPLPCVSCAPRGCCDDYCPKPCCIYLPPCWPAWYLCGYPTSPAVAAPAPR